MITMAILKKHIRTQLKKGKRLNFLGLVENVDLTPEVIEHFCATNTTHEWYNWMNGNDKMKELIENIQQEII